MHASRGFFNAATKPDREPSRPRFVNPLTNEEQSWQRASNFAAPLDSPFGLIKKRTRNLIKGLNARVDLARMLLTAAVVGDKVDEVIEQALAVAEDDAKANNGTAVHAALELCDTGREVPAEYAPHAQGYVAELKRYGLRPVAMEQRVLNTRLGSTGTFDRVYQAADGRYLVGDIKTGRLDHAHKFAVQCEVYAGSDFLVHPNGSSEPIPWDLDRDTALLIHVDPEHGTTTIYAVPLTIGRFGAALAEQVRAFQRMDVLLPFTGELLTPLAAQLHRQAAAEPEPVDAAEFLGMDGEDAQAVASHVETVGHALPERSGEIVAGAHVPTTAQTPAPTGYPVQVGTPEYEAAMADLLHSRNNKAKLQAMLHDLGGRDLAHNRKWLAERIIAARNSAATRPDAPQAPAEPSAAAVAATIEDGKPSAESTPFLLKQIAEAATIDDISRIYRNITERSGLAAWSAEMTQVADKRSAELRAMMGAASGDEPETSPLSRIADAKSTQDLAKVWEQVTNNGANMAAWTPAYNKAAMDRTAELTAPSTPQNPWGTS